MASRASAWQAFRRLVLQWVVADAETDPPATDGLDWARMVPFFAMHLACAAVVFVGWSVAAVVTAVVLYVARMFFITGFYHRHFAHRAFQTSRVFRFLMACCGCTALQRGPLWWAGHHRCHHANADEEPDPHSPRWRGLLYSHALWFMRCRNYATPWSYVKDWAKYPELRWLNRWDWLPAAALALGLYGFGAALNAAWPSLATSGWQMVVWGMAISTVALYHGTYTINSLAHGFGRRRYATNDDSCNNFWLALITLGEGWHNNHHRYPASARQGFRRGELDLAYLGLRALSAVGLIWNLRPVPRSVVAEGSPSSGEGS